MHLFDSMWTRTLLLALCEHGVCRAIVLSAGHPYRYTYTSETFELTRLREMFIVTFNAFVLFFST